MVPVSIIVGIDLGTTNSAVAHMAEDGPRLIPNALGEVLTPSVVGVDADGKLLVGRAARELQVMQPDRCVGLFKRRMGSDWHAELAGRQFSAEELSSLVLRSLKEDAAGFLKEPVERAVITVPAYFNDQQRKATIAAGRIAGLQVERIFNEPTAAALAYGFHEARDEKVLLIFDLGGGTFDVSVVELFEGTLEVRASSGESFLGGEDFTRTLAARLLEQHGHPFERAELQAPLHGVARAPAVRAGQVQPLPAGQLHGPHPRRQGRVPRLLPRGDGHASAVRGVDAAHPEPRRSADPPGAGRRQAVEGGHRRGDPRRRGHAHAGRHRPRHATAGQVAAPPAQPRPGRRARRRRAGRPHRPRRRASRTSSSPTWRRSRSASRSPRSSATRSATATSCRSSSRNSTIPVSRVERVATVAPNQTVLEVKIYQGEGRRVEDNLFLGEFEVKGIPPGPAGQPVDVRFTYDLNGVLEVEATIVETKKLVSHVVTRHARGLSAKQIAEAVRQMEKLKTHPREEAVNRLLLRRAERLYQELSLEGRVILGQLLDGFEAALAMQDAEAIERNRDRPARVPRPGRRRLVGQRRGGRR